MDATSREYKTFTCKCGYKADVFGAKQASYFGIYETHVCLNCRILIDIETAKFVSLNEQQDGFIYKPSTPMCLLCGKEDVILWNSEMCKCPKCEEKMELTRLELNIDGIDTVTII